MDIERIKGELADCHNVNRALIVASMALQTAHLHSSTQQRKGLATALQIVLEERTD